MDKIASNQDNNPSKKLLNFKIVTKMLSDHRKVYLISMPVVLVLGYLLICCVPRYYSSSVTLAPESSEASMGGFSSALSSLGMGSLSKLANNDAISLELYPDLIGSNDFIIKMFPLMVTTKDGKLTTTYYDYLLHHKKRAWWESLTGKIKEIFEKKITDTYTGKANEKINVFSMTKRQQDIAGLVRGNIRCTIDQKTNAITITAKDQDARVCATLADKTAQQLLDFIIDYRTRKAKNDYNYYKKLCDKAQLNYEKARQKYAAYSDTNYEAELESVRSKIEDLENDMQLKFNIYSTMNTQKQTALAKIQEKTPAFTTIESATVPTKPAGPKRMLGGIALMMFYAVVLSVYYLRKYIC